METLRLRDDAAAGDRVIAGGLDPAAIVSTGCSFYFQWTGLLARREFEADTNLWKHPKYQ